MSEHEQPRYVGAAVVPIDEPTIDLVLRVQEVIVEVRGAQDEWPPDSDPETTLLALDAVAQEAAAQQAAVRARLAATMPVRPNIYGSPVRLGGAPMPPSR